MALQKQPFQLSQGSFFPTLSMTWLSLLIKRISTSDPAIFSRHAGLFGDF
jgi:hypothetical protein